jgi:tetratricopeptide (TPR) repeat protein
MLCRSSVYRRLVPEEFWLAMVTDLPKHKQWAALEFLKSHNLAEEELRRDGVLLLRQHNLVKSVTYRLLREDASVLRESELIAAQSWLNSYKPELDAPNLEKVRASLEAFHHNCELENWESAKAILINQGVGEKLQVWGYFQEMLPLYERLLNKLNASVDVICERGIRNSYWYLSNYPQAIEHHHQSLASAREISDHQGEGAAMGNLGAAYLSLGSYSQAIGYYQQSVNIANEASDYQGEGKALGNLGIAYLSLGNHSQAIKHYQQALAIAQEVGDRMGEGRALGYLGFAYCRLGNYLQAIEYHQQKLTIDREIGDLQEEGWALGNLGIAYESLGNYPQAIEHHQQQLMIAREVGDRRGEGSAMGGLGVAYESLGNYSQAIEYHQQWLNIAREICDRWGEGRSLLN